MSEALHPADLRFINRIASLRFAGGPPGALDDAGVEHALAQSADGTPFVRVATLVATILERHVFATAPMQTALLTLHCALAREGLSLLAPQGVVAGMVRALATRGDAAAMAGWLEDRAVPATGG